MYADARHVDAVIVSQAAIMLASKNAAATVAAGASPATAHSSGLSTAASTSASTLAPAQAPAQAPAAFPATAPEHLLRVRYRADVESLFAEHQHQKRFDSPPCIFKHHGDFTRKGLTEFVVKFAEYRDMESANQKQTNDFMKHVMCTRSLLFYGYSISDRDLLHMFDDLTESFGPTHG